MKLEAGEFYFFGWILCGGVGGFEWQKRGGGGGGEGVEASKAAYQQVAAA